MTPAAGERDFERYLEQISSDAHQLQEWASAFRLTAFRKSWLKSWEQEKKEEERRLRNADPKAFFEDDFAAAMATFNAPAQRGKAGHSR